MLLQRVTTDIATKGGQFDIMTVGMYETPIWGKKGWLQEVQPDAAYDVDDLLPALLQQAEALTPAERQRAPLFLPCLAGERTPHNDPHAQRRAVWADA